MANANSVNTTLSGQSGTGNFAGSTSPTFTTPILGTPTSGNLVNCTGYTVANIAGLGTGIGTWLATPSSANLASAMTDETGSGLLVFGTSPTITTPNIVGVTNGSSAVAGSVGEVISSSVPNTTVSLTTATPANVTSIQLTAGQWNIYALLNSAPSAVVTQYVAGISTTSDTLAATALATPKTSLALSFTSGISATIPLMPGSVNINSTTTYYLVAQATFGGTCTAGGILWAERVR